MPADSKPTLDGFTKNIGRPPNMMAAFAQNPIAFNAWAALLGALNKALDVKTRSSEESMIEINADMKAIIKQAILSFVATVNEDGTPNLSPKASLTVANGVLYFADIASPGTIRNLRRNPAVEINVVDFFQRRGYRFKGRALILPPGDDEYWMIADWGRATNGPEYPVDHVVKIEITSITPLLWPAHVFAHPPRSQDEIRNTYYQKYGVKPIGT